MLQARLDAIRLEEKRALEQARGVEMTPTAERQAMKDAVVGPDVAPAPDSAEEAEAFSVVGPDDVAPAPSRRRRAFSASAKASATKLADELLKGGQSMDELTAELIPAGGGGGGDRVRRSRGEGDHGRCLQWSPPNPTRRTQRDG